MPRHRRRPGTRDGLFWNHPDDPDAPGEVRDNPLARPCRSCGARPLERCTRPGRGGRRVAILSGYHDTRTHPATDERGPRHATP